jgi:hypothetical protein
MKNAKALLIGLLSFLAFSPMHSQEKSLELSDFMVTKYFAIIRSTTDYQEALTCAKDAAKRLGWKLDLRGLSKCAETGLTFSKAVCEEGGGSYPSYMPRGRYDDGEYVSIEYSSEYTGFRNGYYIVMIASGHEAKAVKRALAAAIKYFPDAYVRSSKVYMGCIH